MKLVQTPKWKTVYQTKSEHSLHIIKLMLEAEGIPVMVFDQRDSSYNAFGDIYLQVHIDDEERALELINSNE